MEALCALGAERGVPVSSLTTFKIGGPALLTLCTGDTKKLQQALTLCREGHIPCALVGNGSNILGPDEGFNGLLLKLENQTQPPVFEGCLLRAGAGISLTLLARESLRWGFKGLERLCGIPGTLGGAIAMNAGAYGAQISDVLHRVCLLKEEGPVWETADKACFGYRRSPYTWPNAIVLEAELKLAPDDGTARPVMEECTRARREKQPLEYPSAGSFFKRPEGHFAGALIENCGLKGLRVGDAQVSAKHAGFIVNLGHAREADIRALMEQVCSRVMEQTGVALEREVKLLEETACIF